MKKRRAKTHHSKKIQGSLDDSEESLSHEKAALRSQAFSKAILDAKSYATDPELLGNLFKEVAGKAASLPREPFRDSWAYFQAMLRLIRAYHHGEYRLISNEALLTIIAALNYLLDPFDLIPDEIPFLGYIDDATVIAFAVKRTRDDLDDFMTWETSAA